jgi:hypothetical protein
MNPASNQHETGKKKDSACWYLGWLKLQPENAGDIFFRSSFLLSTG